jgi:uncharacterized protein YlzI (FlbEa/FlbD family)
MAANVPYFERICQSKTTHEDMPMIMLTKLDQKKILVNLETVKYLEAVPDTLIFFTNGESVMVQETMDDVAEAVKSYQADLLRRSQGSSPSAL